MRWVIAFEVKSIVWHNREEERLIIIPRNCANETKAIDNEKFVVQES